MKAAAKRRSKPAPKTATKCWAVMRGFPWSALKLADLYGHGVPLNLKGDDQPSRFIPLFDTRRQAVAFNGGDDGDVLEMEMACTPDA